MSEKLILLVEDDKKIQDFNKRMLERSGFIAHTVTTLADAKDFIRYESPNAVILDVGMPDGSGLDFLAELRKISKVPVLLLTGYNETTDIVKGFEKGCDDYLTKPYIFEELHARLNRLLQNAEQVPETVTKGRLILRLIPQTAFVGSEDLLLTPKDFTLLLYFVQNDGVSLEAEAIYEKVWGRPMAGDSRALGNAVSRLRKKLYGSGYTITALYGSGYRFELEKTKI